METFDTIIGQSVKMQGNLSNQGAIQVNGTVEGEIKSESLVIVGAGAVVRGPIKAKVVDISGEVSGTIFADDRLEIQPKGKLYGDITTRNLVIKMGAIFVGKSEVIHDKNGKSEPDADNA
ncbi:MAG: polymer-forming cytoskeletal protein [Patescibacteria group bacterium]